MENKIWIRIEFNNDGQLKGKEELLGELQEVCPVQVRNKWYPSAFPGLEFLVSLHFNINLADFVNNVIIPNIEFLAFYKVCSKVWDAFKVFIKKNEEYDLQHLELCFDDVVIKFNGNPSYGTMIQFYQNIARHLGVLRDNGITGIREIKLPYYEITEDETGRKRIEETNLDKPEGKLLWKVNYYLGCETCYYNPKKLEIIKNKG